ncbi:cytochrome c biogenesis protein ResB [Microbacterium marinilacus]|uniref:Cytochrome c biogenesis protein ResB n=1 Tax=Microbacterium marinilacus TaxID=415209 RepID=A0ABP7BD38_9MICO|nr:cytochrome c biogenesis protein ResB [Microbacterium marinilacus]MBY0686951.1 cytochrome c biogenesis protein ResB [Microbacterium marinilacus]
MSRSRSDERPDTSAKRARPNVARDGSEPLRPSDHVDGGGDADGGVNQPALGVVGWLRWGWRQLTSMRTALILLLLLAIAAVPGSIFPQRMANPNGVTQWESENPDLFPVLDAIQLFDVYQSAWFSAIYILLFVSLVGCILPRTKHHWKALRARPPRTPARLTRLADHLEERVEGDGDDAAHAVDLAEAQLRSAGYRVERYDSRGSFSVSAERGYLRETGNLVFHASLVGVLLAVGIGGGFAYTGQRVVIEGQTVVNALIDYSSMNRGRFVSDDALAPYAMRLDSFDVTYQPVGESGAGQAGDFSANVTIREPDGTDSAQSVRVNHPLDVDGERVYLLGNGYAPTVTLRDADGEIQYQASVPFLPQDANMTSLGVIKVPDGFAEQLGLVGFFYPTQLEAGNGAFASVFGDLINPVLTLDVYSGDLGIDDGTPRNVYTLDPTGMEKLTGVGTDVDSIELAPGESADLPNGMGTITFEDETPEDADLAQVGLSESVKRFVSLQSHRDGSAVFVLAFAVLAVLGLLTALFVPRRRVWVKATPDGTGIRIEYAALARGEDPTLAAAIDDIRSRHLQALRD